ncbi:phosphotransferase [Psychrobacillus vulpis]|uniref:Aminoglycoside phosphotransferase family protein n=1 Tax=Psychrobacillus vulpis TaxID=2325572 RepID=A0A544TT31_9BACI|nr:phosphotransferase [Psychrobacillus vulpis]TQR20599.1 aminoglycoside phosphotransferase family protein [Psychrobacillus vulpis]
MILTNNTIEKLSMSILNVLNKRLDWQIEEISFIDNGVVNAVFLINEKNLGKLAVRTPWRSEENMMDKDSSGIISLKKEATISEHCHKYQIPVPKIHKLYLSNEINFLVSDFVSGDNQEISSYDIGELTSKIHTVPLDGLSIVDQNERTLSNIVSHRIAERVKSLSKLMNINIVVPSQEEFETILDTSQTKNSLLHLDVRQPNLIGENGKIKAIIDWDNAIIGNPIMELMRISESEELNEGEFLKGYKEVDIIKNTDAVIQSIYRLDTALMLSILFTFFINDSEKRDYYVKRVHFLTQEIRKYL